MRSREINYVIRAVALSLGVATMGGCASTGGGGETAAVGATRHELEAQLRAAVEAELESARERQGADNAEVIFKRPSYYKQYYEYPSDTEVFSLEFTEKESRTTPLTAELEVEKVRFATRLHDKRDEASNDENYLRSRGIDYISYECRHGDWRRVSNLFLARSTEEKVEGEWRQIEEKRTVSLVAEEPKSWWDRLKFWE